MGGGAVNPGGERVAGVILYLGRRVVSFGKNFYAVPMAALWQW